MSYLGEFRANARPLIGATIGAGVGNYVLAYIIAIFAPPMMAEFGWTKAQFALLGATTLAIFFVLPVVGRSVDVFGTRKVALLGVFGIPLCFVGFSLNPGSFAIFCVINIIMLGFSMAASSLVYTRVVAQKFDRARGLALTVITCAPALVGAVGSPLLDSFIGVHGWRAGYVLTAAVFLFAGLLGLYLIGSTAIARDNPLRRQGSTKQTFAVILKARPFWLILGGIGLWMLPNALHTSQLKLMLLDQNLTSATAATMISIYAASTVVGRVLCGLALDRFPAHLVSALSLALPSIGYVFLATTLDATPYVVVSVMLIGLSVGAESDIIAYLVARWFKVDIYSSTLGIVSMGVPVSVTVGALLLSYILHVTDSFAPYLWLAALCVLAGSLLIFRLGEPREQIGPEPVTA